MAELLHSYRHERIIAQDSKTKTVTLLGSIEGKSAIISAEKSAFDVEDIESITRPKGVFDDVSNNIYVCDLSYKGNPD